MTFEEFKRTRIYLRDLSPAGFFHGSGYVYCGRRPLQQRRHSMTIWHNQLLGLSSSDTTKAKEHMTLEEFRQTRVFVRNLREAAEAWRGRPVDHLKPWPAYWYGGWWAVVLRPDGRYTALLNRDDDVTTDRFEHAERAAYNFATNSGSFWSLFLRDLPENLMRCAAIAAQQEQEYQEKQCLASTPTSE